VTRHRRDFLVSVCAIIVVPMIAESCRHSAPPPLPAVPAAALSVPVPVAAPIPVLSPVDSGGAPIVAERSITLTGEWDVRLALEEIAKDAGFSLIVSPKVPAKKVRLSLVNVPASAALKAVLDAGQLTLQGTNGMQIPWNPSVVFYQLPVNVDSLSAEAIAKRFGISRELAELMVKARTP
jgi:hypothetical protein